MPSSIPATSQYDLLLSRFASEQVRYGCKDIIAENHHPLILSVTKMLRTRYSLKVVHFQAEFCNIKV